MSDFSELEYLALNPDVARAVARGEFESGRSISRDTARLKRVHRAQHQPKKSSVTLPFFLSIIRDIRTLWTSLERRGSRPCRMDPA
jgi:hypothetical protein